MTKFNPLKFKSIAHPPTEQCPDLECSFCGKRDCPFGEPLHYHHDGCPACDAPEPPVQKPTWSGNPGAIAPARETHTQKLPGAE